MRRQYYPVIALVLLVGFQLLQQASEGQPSPIIPSINATNATNATTVELVNVTNATRNAAIQLENATDVLTNITRNLQQNISSILVASPPPPLPPTSNASVVNSTTIINSIFDSNLPALFIIVIFLIIIIPLVFDMYLAYMRRPKEGTTKEGENKAGGMPGLYRSLMTFGIILLVGTVIFYLLALITLNINSPNSAILQSLIDVLKNLGTILGTALATIIAFYFGMRGVESATEKAKTAPRLDDEKVPPRVLNTLPADGATGVPVNSLVTATFSESMNSPTIDKESFTVKKQGETTPLKGVISLSPDGRTAIFDSEVDFSPNTKYDATIDIGAQDLAGNALVSAKRWSFTTKPNA